MTDQPPTNHSDYEATTDQPDGQPGVVGDQPQTDQDPGPSLLTLEEAAAELGISVNAVRQRIKRGTVIGIRTDDGWLVDMVATNQRSTTHRPTSRPTDHVVDSSDQRPTTDLEPLVDLINKQTEKISELSAAVGMWQARAMHLEERLQQLTATVERSADAPERAESADQVSDFQHEPSTQSEGIWARLVHFLRGQ